MLNNNSLVLMMTMPDNMSRIGFSRDLSGEKLLEQIPKTDEQVLLAGLIRRSQEGDMAAFGGIYNLFKKKVYGLAFSFTRDHQTSEDLTQDVFLKVFSSIREIEQTELFPAWVYRISLNTCYSFLRREKSFEDKLDTLKRVEEAHSDRAFDSPQDDLSRLITDALALLPKNLKTVFILHEVEGLKHEEIARILGCQVGTSKSQLFKARMKLRKILKKHKLLEGAGQ
jgi:RNA polymerase sigma-70 factor (ECF subfamily)